MRRYVKYPIIVEGRYDKAHLSSFLDAEIYTTNGFSVYKPAQKNNILKALDGTESVIIITDSDRAGLQIRGHLLGIIKNKNIINIYLPQIVGKESRKTKASADGFLGVEAIAKEKIIKELERQGAFEEKSMESFSSAFFYEIGLTGVEYSKKLREKLATSLDLPQGLSVSALKRLLPRLVSEDALRNLVTKLRFECADFK